MVMDQVLKTEPPDETECLAEKLAKKRPVIVLDRLNFNDPTQLNFDDVKREPPDLYDDEIDALLDNYDIEAEEPDVDDIICEYCDAIFPTSQMLEEHMKIHMEFANVEQSDPSLENVPKSQINSTTDEESLAESRKEKLNNVEASIQPKILVRIKEELFDPSFGLENNTSGAAVNFDTSCRTDDAKSDGREEEKKEDLPCDIQTKPIDKNNENLMHCCNDINISIGQSKSTPTGKTYNCEVCDDEVFSDLDKFCEHMKQHNMGESEDQGSDVEPIEKSFCELCGTDFPDVAELLTHMNEHMGQNSDDTVDEKFPCVMCNAEFTDSKILSNHVRAHVEKHLFTCKFCEMGFARQSSLNRHVMTHSKDDEKQATETSSIIEYQYLCKFCKQLSSSHESFKNHLDFECQGKTFRCEICAERFVTKLDVQRHTNLHSKTKAQQRKSCQKIVNIKKLQKKHRPNGIVNGTKDKVRKALKDKKRTLFERRFSCKTCGKAFAYEARFNNHVTLVHGSKTLPSNDSKFLCKKCGKKFTYRACFQKHLGEHQKIPP